jgi:hypothetical protein
MADANRNRDILGGFGIGMGSIIVIGGFVIWFLTNSFLITFISWAGDHGYTLAPSSFGAMNQVPLLCAVIIVLGFVGILMGTGVVMEGR